MLFEHSFKLDKAQTGPRFVCMMLQCTQESVLALTDHLADAFVRKNGVHVSDVVAT